MPPVKTRAIVLKTLPYRESSYILYLFTESHGLIHGVAKGIRKAKKGQSFLERGFLLELLVYVKPQQELHLLSSVNVLEFFSSTRSSLMRSAVRDVVFELVLGAITVSDPHPEMFAFFEKVLGEIERKQESFVYPFMLWAFYQRFADLMGFALNLDTCMLCGARIVTGNVYLSAARGGVECAQCAGAKAEAVMIHESVRSFLKGMKRAGDVRREAGGADVKRTTRLLADFCRYHFDIRSESKALGFLEGIGGRLEAGGEGREGLRQEA